VYLMRMLLRLLILSLVNPLVSSCYSILCCFFTEKSYQLQHQIITLLPLIMFFEKFLIIKVTNYVNKKKFDGPARQLAKKQDEVTFWPQTHVVTLSRPVLDGLKKKVETSQSLNPESSTQTPSNISIELILSYALEKCWSKYIFLIKFIIRILRTIRLIGMH
jgi:hypothetical protein